MKFGKMRPLTLISVLTITACLLLSSCSGLLDSGQPAQRTFLLTPYSPSVAAPTGGEINGLTVKLAAAPGLDSDRLLTLSPDAGLSHFSGARWPDHLPEFAGSLVRRSLQQTGWFSKVSDGRDSGSGECALKLEVQQFYTLLDSAGIASAVRIGMSGSFACNGRPEPLDLNASARVSGQSLGAVVAAHQQAMDQLLRSLITELDGLRQHE